MGVTKEWWPWGEKAWTSKVLNHQGFSHIRTDVRGEIVMMALERPTCANVLLLLSHTFVFCGCDQLYYSHFTDAESQGRKTETPPS